MQEEDDDSPDFNFVLPKKLKPSTTHKKDKENLPKKPPKGKYKMWKHDYFRDKDREAMADITKQLKRHRKKVKTSLTKSLSMARSQAKSHTKSTKKSEKGSKSSKMSKASKGSSKSSKASTKPGTGGPKGKYA